MSQVINSEVIYRPDTLPLGSSRQVQYFESSKGVLKQGNRAYITVPNLRNSFIDTSSAYIQFTVQNLTLVGTNLPFNSSVYNYNGVGLSSCGAAAFIQSIDILQNGSLVSRIDNANKINGLLTVANNSNVGTSTTQLTSGNSTSLTGAMVATPICEYFGKPLAASTATLSILPSMTFTLNNDLLSFMGDGCMMPISQLKNGCEIQIQFINDPREAIVMRYGHTCTSATCEFLNVAYVAPIVQLDQSSYDAVVRDNGFGSRNVIWSGVGYHCSTQQLTSAQQSAAGDYTLLVPNNRFSSLRHLHVGGFYNQSATSQEDQCLPRIPFNTLYYRMNGREYPQNRIDTLGKVVLNTVSCNSSVNNSVGTTLMSSTGTTLSDRQAVLGGFQTYAPRGVVGLSLETFNDTESISGICVSNTDTEAILGLSGDAATFDSTLGFLSTYDVLYVVSPEGVLSSSYT